jgi:hypothetical protein
MSDEFFNIWFGKIERHDRDLTAALTKISNIGGCGDLLINSSNGVNGCPDRPSTVKSIAKMM